MPDEINTILFSDVSIHVFKFVDIYTLSSGGMQGALLRKVLSGRPTATPSFSVVGKVCRRPQRQSTMSFTISCTHVNQKEQQEEEGANRSKSFKELGIDKDLYNKTGGIRFRQHVNPLKKELQEPTKPLNWYDVYEDPTKPLMLDIGSGYGRFLLGLTQVETEKNGLGLEIRDPIIKRANEWSKHLGLHKRVHFVRSNATVSIATMLETYPGPIELVSIQFPDPHFKKKHRKRRIVQESLVRDIVRIIAPQGRILLQSDVLNVAVDMRDKFERACEGKLALSHLHDASVFYEEEEENVQEEKEEEEEMWTGVWKEGGWLKHNPLPVPTERECLVQEQGGSVYRIMLVVAA
jgi:tRNA (guanine-N7-)-methyltransferase